MGAACDGGPRRRDARVVWRTQLAGYRESRYVVPSCMRASVIRQSLVCPVCHGELGGGAHLACSGCGRSFPALPDGRWDFRLAAGDSIVYERRYSPATSRNALDVPLRLERPSDPPRNQFGTNVPVHLTAAQVSYLPAGQPGQIAVDLGCGHGAQRGVLERLGYTCWAVD